MRERIFETEKVSKPSVREAHGKVKESLQNEDGWSEEIVDILEPPIEEVEELAYELRNTVRGAKTGVDDVDGLIDHCEHIMSRFDDAIDDLEDDADKLNEDYDEDRYEKIRSKYVYDYDGFTTDYTLYFDHEDNNYFTVFGDNDLYGPEDEHDWDFGPNEDEALEWFEDYEGFVDTEDVDLELTDDDLNESLNESLLYRDNGAGLAEKGYLFTIQELGKIYDDSVKAKDPVVMEYKNFSDWMNDTVESGLLEIVDERAFDESCNEAYYKNDFSDIPLIDGLDYNFKRSSMPGITNVKQLIQALESKAKEVGDEFKIRSTRVPWSESDIKDSWMDIQREGWHIGRAIDSSLKGFNEVYICSKITGNKTNEKLIQSSSDKAFKKNIATEIKAGKDPKQAAAIAYSVKRKNESLSDIEFNDILGQFDDREIDYWDASVPTRIIWFRDDDAYSKAKEFLDKRKYKYTDGVNAEGVKYFELKESVEDGWEEVSGRNGYRLFRKIEDGKGKWRAQKCVNGECEGEPFDITYEQALGREPIEDKPIAELSKKLGKILLPKREGVQDLDESLDISDEDFQQRLKNELQGKLQYHYKKLGYTQREIEDYIMPVYKTEFRKGYGDDGSDALFVWVGAEVDYDELEELASVLNRVIRKYDKDAYFEPETSGRLISVLWD